MKEPAGGPRSKGCFNRGASTACAPPGQRYLQALLAADPVELGALRAAGALDEDVGLERLGERGSKTHRRGEELAAPLEPR